MKAFHLGVISDIHLGHPRTSTEFIIENLNKYFSNDKYFSSVDMVVFAGDVYDNILTLGSLEAGQIDRWIARVLRLAKKHNVLLRVLEGTPLHDRTQPRRFAILDELAKKNHPNDVDLKYVDTLSLEYIERFDIRVLYMPDEINNTTDVTLAQVKELMNHAGWDQVDFGFFHGAFSYQLPEIVSPLKTHSLEEYTKLIRVKVYIGHVHFRSMNGIAVAQGSFDRLAQGEEGMKGFVHSNFEADGTHQTHFVDNPTAKVYKNVYFAGDNVEQALIHIGQEVEGLIPGSYVRIEVPPGSPLLTEMYQLALRWPHYIWDSKTDGKKAKGAERLDQLLLDEGNDHPAIVVNRQNIAALMLERLAKKGVPSAILQQCEPYLREVETI